MKLGRARTPTGEVTGTVSESQLRTESGAVYDFDAPDVDRLAPCQPGTFYCVGRNYAATIDQMDYDVPEQPDWFIKPPVALHHPDDPFVYPSWTDELTYGGELAAVIDERCSRLTDEHAVKSVLRGWTIMNDLDALDQPGRTARKAFDGAAPLGPVIETDIEPRDVDMETHVAGERRQRANTGQMLFDPFETIRTLSERYTFRPGDVVAFGTPANPGLLEPGDDVEVWYEGIGTLSTTVVAPEPPS